jgi:transketolase N-terminal domain/subunit
MQQSKRANVGHIGSALSVADIVGALYGGVLRLPALDAPDRDRFVLGKGHSVLAVYARDVPARLAAQAELDTYCATAACSASIPIASSPASTSRPARSASACPSASAPRSRRASRIRPSRLRPR